MSPPNELWDTLEPSAPEEDPLSTPALTAWFFHEMLPRPSVNPTPIFLVGSASGQDLSNETICDRIDLVQHAHPTRRFAAITQDSMAGRDGLNAPWWRQPLARGIAVVGADIVPWSDGRRGIVVRRDDALAVREPHEAMHLLAQHENRLVHERLALRQALPDESVTLFAPLRSLPPRDTDRVHFFLLRGTRVSTAWSWPAVLLRPRLPPRRRLP